MSDLMSSHIPNRNSIETLHGEHRRLAILRALLRLPGFTANLPLMRDHLDTVGLITSWDAIRGDFQRLKEMGLVEVCETPDSAWRVSLTERGNDAAEGRIVVEGVSRAEPSCPY